MRTPSILLLAALVGLPVATVRGEDRPAAYDPRAAFAESDTNRDGAVDHEEFHERMVEIFYRADANKDGFLDPTELVTLVFPEDFTTNDKDRDGRVAMREFLRVRFRDFTAADRDDDGVLSVDEVVRIYEGKKGR